MINSNIIATGSYIPSFAVKNDDIAEIVDTNDEWISSRTGIKERRISKEDTSIIAYKACLDALKSTHIDPKQIDLIIVATTSPEYFVPSTACIVQEKLRASNAVCFDVSAACSGFLYAMNIADSFISSGKYKNALIVGAEVLSKLINWKDRNTCILFGDGAGAAVITKAYNKGIMDIKLTSHGDKWRALKCKTRNLRDPFVNKNNLHLDLNSLSYENEEMYVNMQGKEIFKFAVNTIEKSIINVLKENELTMDDIKYIVCHQANLRIINSASNKLGIPKEKFYINLHKYGNTSGASIPIALDEMNKKNMLNTGDKIILVAFGGGLTTGYSLINWNGGNV